MGVKIALRRSTVNVDDGRPVHADPNGNEILPSPASTSKPVEAAPPPKCNKGEKSVLDDIMGDPDDFQDFGDLGAGSDGEPGRWEDTCRKCFSADNVIVEGKVLGRTGSEADKKGSPDNLRENASIVDSSLTESKQDVDNREDRGISSYKGNEPCNFIMADEQENHSFVGRTDLNDMQDKNLNVTRYFIIKSLSHRNIELSVERGIWATQVMNEPILEEAFHNSDRVILIFSVNMSGYFQGYAQMMSPVGWRRDNVWSESSAGSNPWGRTFRVKWLRLHDLPFQKTLHLKNPLNDYKPVKISRDCQELTQEIGEALCELIDGQSGLDGKLKRGNAFRDEYYVKRPCRESPVPSTEDEYSMSAHSSQIAWGRTSVPYPSYPQDLMLSAARNLQVPYARSADGLHSEPVPSPLEVKKGSCKWHHAKPANGRDGNCSSWLDKKDYPTNERAPFDDSVSEEDILDMTYEEYLQAHARNRVPFSNQTMAPSHSSQVKPTKKEDEDQYSKYLANWYSSQRRRLMSTISIPHQ
ncbi:uncharacterized protein LOC116261259 [Nymphaea colorata]|nr:uncharacterized protein LOC116261259 [Nymphaea colorata]XP_031495799.1 uncharacterized protein LOC116261259 [Nymphaea colorata]XP_031495800.1 uncharacterized protein LOC116261259 [Nymphaea colorata]XP_031495801.1 uncharacterized protein LOC116261259 [Nymphaea colorata]